MSHLKLHKTQAMDNIFIEENLLPWLNFNPGLELTGFRTTRPRATKEIMTATVFGYLILISIDCFILLLHSLLSFSFDLKNI